VAHWVRAAAPGLRERAAGLFDIFPRVQAMPGFQAGHWAYDAGPSRTHSFIVFDTEAQAQGLVDLVREENAQPNPFGVRIFSATVAEVTLQK